MSILAVSFQDMSGIHVMLAAEKTCDAFERPLNFRSSSQIFRPARVDSF